MQDFKVFSDPDLLSLLKSGNAEAFTEIYKRNWSAMYLYARKLINDEAMAEDIVQEVMLYVWNKRFALSTETKLIPYLYTALRHNALRKIERSKHYDKYLNSLQDFIEENQTSADSGVLEKEMDYRIQKAISELPPKMRIIFELSRLEYLSQKSIAERLNISERTVKNQVTTALKILRGKLGLALYLTYFADISQHSHLPYDCKIPDPLFQLYASSGHIGIDSSAGIVKAR